MSLLKVLKQVLNNGLNILVVPRKVIPKVSIQLWYNVGSKDEQEGQKGIAHLIEHMIFKGTELLSECDINQITHKLSGYCNAFTSYDYTGYLFDFPSQHWYEALPIMADCMKNCVFKQEFLNSELKAVIQELKMYKDDYSSTIIELLISIIFSDHPYHHPIIGYKQDLWNLERQHLVDFYKYHYIPNNATLVVVGDIEPDNVFEYASKYFGPIQPNFEYRKKQFYHSPDLVNKEVTIYRDIKEPIVVLAWKIPGTREKKDYLVNIISWILGSGRGSRLYKKLINELELVTELEVFHYDLFEHGLFFIYFRPKSLLNIKKIEDVIVEEIEKLITQGLLSKEILRAIKKTEVDFLTLLENNQKQAYAVGKFYLATGDEQYVYKYTEYPKENLEREVIEFIDTYLKFSLMNKASVLPLQNKERKFWLKLQEISDEEDARVLSDKERISEIEEAKCKYDVIANPPKKFEYPKTQTVFLDNGLKLLYYNNNFLPKIDFILDFKARNFYDPSGLEGLSLFVANMLQEGTKHYSAAEFADTLESYGMKLSSSSGSLSISMLSADLAKGLELLNEVLTEAVFDEQSIEKVRSLMIAHVNQFWDEPIKFVNQIAKQEIYKNHPYGKDKLGTVESLKKITKDNLMNFYKYFLSPRGSRLSVAGDLERYDVKECFNHMLYGWSGQAIKDIDFPEIAPVKYKEINYQIMRDQTVLCYAGLSVERTNEDYDKLLLFDQIFTGGVLGSMSSKLFDLRERSGLFYTIGGSLIYNVDKQPGLIIIKTIVSNDRLYEAEKAIENVINTAVDNINEDEFEEAQRAIINSLVDNFSSNSKIAAVSLLKDEYDFPQDYFDKRAEQLNSITIDQIQEAVKKYLSVEKMIKIRVGRV